MMRLLSRRRRALLLVVLIFAPGPLALPLLAAPEPLAALAESWRWRLFDQEEGLSSNPVSALFQDREDYIYAAADDGVFRYDLHGWEAIEVPDSFDGADVVGFAESMNVIYCVTSRALWAVRPGARLQRFYPRPGAAGGRIFVAGGKLGEAYLIDEGIDEGGGAHLQIRGQKLDAVDRGVVLPAGRIHDYQVDQQRVHWLATELGLFRRDLGQRRWEEVKDRDLDLEFARAECERFYCFKKRLGVVAKGSRGGRQGPEVHELWALFQSRQDSALRTLARLADRSWEAVPAAIDGPPVEHVVMDQQGNAYATCEDGRLFFRRATAAGIEGEWQFVDALGPGQVKLHGGLLDSAGNLWFRLGAGGVAFFDLQSRRWEALPGRPGRPYPKVLSLLESTRGDIWVGTSSGVFRYPPSSTTDGGDVESAAPEFFETVLELELREITGLAEDGHGNIWISSADAEAFPGAFYFNREADTWVQAAFCDFPIRRIVTDRIGELWFLPHFNAGLAADGDSPALVYRRSAYTGDAFREVRVERAPVDLVRTQGDVFWLATRRGLAECVLEGDGFVVRRWYTEKDGLVSPWLSAVAEGPDGAIWVCYHLGGGVARVHGGEVTTYDMAEDPASPAALSVLAAGPNLWFGTDRGLTRYDGECWYSFPVASASPRSWVYTIVAPRDVSEQNGLLLGSLTHGVLRFRMDDRRRPRFMATELPDNVDRSGFIEFSWDARDYKNQTLPSELLFRYRLDGGPWSTFGHMRKVSFASLAPGEHTFEVEVRDLDGNRNREELVHRVGVQTTSTPFPWLLTVVGLGTLLLIVGGLGLRDYLRWRRQLWRRYRGLFRDYPAPLFLIDQEGRVLEYNEVRPGSLGLEGINADDLIGRPLFMLPAFASRECRGLIRRVLDGQNGRLADLVCSFGSAGERVLELHAFALRESVLTNAPASGHAGDGDEPAGVSRAAILGAVVVVHDRTRQVEEERLRLRDRRLESLRDLARRLAVEMREIFEALKELPGITLEEGGSEPGGSLGGTLGDKLHGFDLMARSLRDFADSPVEELTGRSSAEVELEGLLEPLLGLDGNGMRPPLRTPLAPGVDVDYRSQTGLWAVRAEEGPLREVLYQVLRNASEAMPEKGKLTVRASNLRLENGSGALPPGSYVELTVDDEGPGIDPHQLEAVFDPFYSTKPRDRAQGLGLSLAYGIIRRQGGDIRVHSRPGAGTSVRILLPAQRA